MYRRKGRSASLLNVASGCASVMYFGMRMYCIKIAFIKQIRTVSLIQGCRPYFYAKKPENPDNTGLFGYFHFFCELVFGLHSLKMIPHLKHFNKLNAHPHCKGVHFGRGGCRIQREGVERVFISVYHYYMQDLCSY